MQVSVLVREENWVLPFVLFFLIPYFTYETS